MKTRNGFVSNSSSSSFVIMGFKLDDILIDIDQKKFIQKFNPEGWKRRGDLDPTTDIRDLFDDTLYDANFNIPNVRYLSDDGPGYIGLVLADISSEDSYADKKTLKITDCLQACERLRKLLGIKAEPQIYTGTRSC